VFGCNDAPDLSGTVEVLPIVPGRKFDTLVDALAPESHAGSADPFLEPVRLSVVAVRADPTTDFARWDPAVCERNIDELNPGGGQSPDETLGRAALLEDSKRSQMVQDTPEYVVSGDALDIEDPGRPEAEPTLGPRNWIKLLGG
jgi:hypothetical protein